MKHLNFCRVGKNKTVNSLSAGKSSSLLAKKYPADYEIFSCVCIDDIECAPKDPTVISYANQKLEKFIPEFGEFIATAEDDMSLRAMMDLEQFLGKEIIWVRGKSYDKIIDERHQRTLVGIKKRLPSWARRFCTEEMKLIPIFYWWFYNIGEKVDMRIGFRFDEFDRLERFFNNSNQTMFKIPISCKTYGQKMQVHQEFNWRNCHFPLIKAGITKEVVDEYWLKNGWVGDIFTERRKIQFPVISNCVGCFHKKVETLAAESILNPAKMKWFAKQEKKNMGTWLDSKQTYAEIMQNADELAKEVLYEMRVLGQSCDSGGCTD